MNNPRTSEQINDPIVDEIRAIRRARWEEAGQDLDVYFSKLLEYQATLGDRVASPEEPQAEAVRPKHRRAG